MCFHTTVGKTTTALVARPSVSVGMPNDEMSLPRTKFLATHQIPPAIGSNIDHSSIIWANFKEKAVVVCLCLLLAMPHIPMRTVPALVLLFAVCMESYASRDWASRGASIQTLAGHGRTLQQAVSGNCTPPRTAEDAMKPFCFVPDTISPEARQILATTSSSAVFGNLDFVTEPTQQAATVARLRETFAALTRNLSRAAEAQYIERTRNDTVGGVQVLVAVPKGVTETVPANTKVLLYIHGEQRS